MTKLLKNSRFVVLLIALIMMLSLMACSDANFPKPDETVTGFFDSLSKADFKTMETYCANSSSSNDFKFKDANEEKIAKLMFAKTKAEIIESKVEGDTATLKVKMTSLDMAKVFESMMKDIIEKATNAALNGEEVSDAKAEEMTMKYLEDSMSKADAPVTTKEMEIKLTKDKKKKAWIIQDDEVFGKALLGNLDDMMNEKK